MNNAIFCCLERDQLHALISLLERDTGQAFTDLSTIFRNALGALDEPDRAEILAAARNEYESEGDIEIDDTAVISRSAGGAYVMAWAYIYNEEYADQSPTEDDEVSVIDDTNL